MAPRIGSRDVNGQVVHATVRRGGVSDGVSRTATPTLNDVIGCYSVAISEFSAAFLNRLQRSVNRKVQGSNPCPGAKFEFELVTTPALGAALCSHFVTIL
jgi:hypothetical protein